MAEELVFTIIAGMQLFIYQKLLQIEKRLTVLEQQMRYISYEIPKDRD